MVTCCLAVTFCVVIVKVAVVFPEGMTTLEGTAAKSLELSSEIVSPLLGAGEVMTTVPTEGDPPFTVEGLSVSDFRVGGFNVIGAI